MSLDAVYVAGKVALSFELFPPKTPEAEAELFEHLPKLAAFSPDFFTCTYGAGGSTRQKTLGVLTRLKRELGLPTAAHLTCVGSTVDALRQFLKEAAALGIDYIVALRGDPPRGETSFVQVPGGLRYANELVHLIRTEFPQFQMAVAGYPETHKEAASPDQDLQNLRRKVEAGAHVVITQLFYDNADFFAFQDRCKRIGIAVPIVPGLLPVTNLSQVKRIAEMCGSKLPAALAGKLEACKDSPELQFETGVRHAVSQAKELMDRGVPGLHFYVLNRSNAACRILEEVGWKKR